jgi:hypothetical protein
VVWLHGDAAVTEGKDEARRGEAGKAVQGRVHGLASSIPIGNRYARPPHLAHVVKPLAQAGSLISAVEHVKGTWN